jgi:hypothetical protein
MPLNQLSLPLVLFLGILLLDLINDQAQIILWFGFLVLKSHVAIAVLWVQFLRMAT